MSGEFAQGPDGNVRANSQTQREQEGQLSQFVDMSTQQEKDFFDTRKFSQAGSENFHLYSQTQLQLKEEEAYSVPGSDRNRHAAGSDQDPVMVQGRNQP